jgi:hypothetical protein
MAINMTDRTMGTTMAITFVIRFLFYYFQPYYKLLTYSFHPFVYEFIDLFNEDKIINQN